jgi:hypothetical protein
MMEALYVFLALQLRGNFWAQPDPVLQGAEEKRGRSDMNFSEE